MTPQQAAEAMRETCALECERRAKSKHEDGLSRSDDSIGRICCCAGAVGMGYGNARAIRALKVDLK